MSSPDPAPEPRPDAPDDLYRAYERCVAAVPPVSFILVDGSYVPMTSVEYCDSVLVAHGVRPFIYLFTPKFAADFRAMWDRS